MDVYPYHATLAQRSANLHFPFTCDLVFDLQPKNRGSCASVIPSASEDVTKHKAGPRKQGTDGT